MDALLPQEILLLVQAVHREGATSFEAVSRRVCSHPALAGRPESLFTPSALLARYRELLGAEGVDGSNPPAELKRPNARLHFKMAHKCYAARLSEIKRQLALEEDQMRLLLQEIETIQNGAWDAKLTASYPLVQPSPDPHLARYSYGHSATPSSEGTSAIVSQPPPEPLERTAPLGKGTPTSQPTQADGDLAGRSSGSDTQLVTEPTTQINDLQTSRLLTSLNDAPKTAQSLESTLPSDSQPNAVQLRTSSRAISSIPSRSSLADRRASTRSSRSSVGGLSEITIAETLPMPTSDEAVVAVAAEATSNSAAARDSPPVIGAMDRENSRDSVPPKRAVRPARKSSVPPKETANKRKRTTTPQAPSDKRVPSPALSDQSRSKRVKTEEPESSIGTPAEFERTPFGSAPSESLSRRFRRTAPHLIDQLHSSVYSTYFKEPVRPGDAANYFEIVKRPMDLRTLQQNVKSGKVGNSIEFTRDIVLIFANAIMYNGDVHHVGLDAAAMWREAQDLLQVLEAAEHRVI